MIVANIFDPDGSMIGSIDREVGGFRISWRERMEGTPGNVHSFDHQLHPTFEEARQAVYRVNSDVQIVETTGGGT